MFISELLLPSGNRIELAGCATGCYCRVEPDNALHVWPGDVAHPGTLPQRC